MIYVAQDPMILLFHCGGCICCHLPVPLFLTSSEQNSCRSVWHAVLGEQLIRWSNAFVLKLDIVIDDNMSEHCLHLVGDEETTRTNEDSGNQWDTQLSWRVLHTTHAFRDRTEGSRRLSMQTRSYDCPPLASLKT